MQLLLAKIFDEHAFENRRSLTLGVQDYSVLGTPASIAKQKFEKILEKAVSFYEKHLPNKIPKNISITGETLIEVLKILAPIRIIHSKRDVVQTFYMKFAKDLYKWDIAQFFTPTTVTDFIVDILNPQFGEHICDPACGSADFLVAAFRILRQYNPGYADCVWGVDNSSNAVQISVLNMLLNGDGKTNIKKDDSLENVGKYLSKYDIMVCNPPFGSKILEKRSHVLKNYDLGFEWVLKDGVLSKSDKLLESQETGMLFVEVCVKQCKPGGRIAIILPNGYLGNRSSKFKILRRWMLLNTKVAAITAFPRFTFKSSGADVSASVIFLEKLEHPLKNLNDLNYSIAIEMIEKVGWDAGNKKALPIYKRNKDDGSFIINDDGDFIIDSDFNRAISNIRTSEAAEDFSWLVENQENEYGNGWSIDINAILKDDDLTLDPKRYCRKVCELRDELIKQPYILLGDIVDFMPERFSSSGFLNKISISDKYNYLEIQDINQGDYKTHSLMGWELPSRAKHFAESNDIYFGSIWGSVSKWCYIGDYTNNVVVTNGCHRCRVKEEKKEFLLDFLSYINTEGWATQMRSLARGSDGLAEISVEDAKNIVIPLIDDVFRSKIEPYINDLQEGKVTFNSTIKSLILTNMWKVFEPTTRPSHIVLV